MNINGKVKVHPVNGVPFIATVTQSSWGRYSSQFSGVIMAEVIKMNVPRLAEKSENIKEGVTIEGKFYHVMKIDQKGVNYMVTLSDNSEIELPNVVK